MIRVGTGVLPLLLGIVTLLAGCGGNDADPAEMLSQTAANLGTIYGAESLHRRATTSTRSRASSTWRRRERPRRPGG